MKKQAKTGRSERKSSARDGRAEFSAEAEYAESIFQSSLGDTEASIVALRRSLGYKPDYAPALLSVGSVEYQLGRRVQGRKFFHLLLSLPKNTPDIITVIDEAGEFLIARRNYKDGLELYRSAAIRFPETAIFHHGIGCCAGHERFFDEGIAASQRACALEPDNPEFTNDLGYALYEVGRLKEARVLFEKAVAMDPANELIRNNLTLCKRKMHRAKREQ